jgi:DNA-directed RNA polymerase II subunit RPB1
MSTIKFGMSPSLQRTNPSMSSFGTEKIPIKPGKQEVKDPEKPKPKNSFFSEMLAKAATTKSDVPNVTKKTELKEVPISDEPRTCPSSFKEIDIAKRMKEMEDTIQTLEEYDIVGAELSIFDIETLAKNNEAPKITSSDSNGSKGSLRGSLTDPRMGVVENNAICETCGGDNIQCPGHFGYIKLNTPIYHPLFAPLIAKILSSICITCGSIYLSEEMMREKGIFNYNTEKRLTLLSEESTNQMCQQCQETDSEDGKKKKTKGCPGTQIPFIWNKDCMNIQAQIGESIVVKGMNFEKEVQSEKEKSKKIKGRTVTISDVGKILKGLDDKTVSLLGFSNGAHPKKFIIEYFPVLPPISRQPKFIDGKVIEDKLTEQYRTIISKNDAVGSAKNENKATATRALYDEIDKFIQGSDSGKKGDFKSIKGRLQGKDERIRGTMMGRRVNFSARTVLGPKPSLRFGQIALPNVWNKQLRIEERVFEKNKEKLQKMLEEGKIHFIFPCDGKYKGLPVFVNDTWREKYKLKIGDKVERELMTGDYTIFNRQPTLHKQSIMGYQVLSHEEFTLGMHISTTRPHNADFDGDEGNINQVSSLESIAEVMTLMNVKDNIMNSQTNRPIMSLAFDSITGAYLMTADTTKIKKEDFYQLIMLLTELPNLKRLETKGKEYGLITLSEDNQPLYSGKLLFSSALPEDFYYEYEEENNTVIIKEGILISGRLSSKTVGAGHNSIIQALYKFYPRYQPFVDKNGDTEVVKFITNATFLMDGYLAMTGYSIKMEDCLLPEHEREKQEKIIEDVFLEAQRAAYKISKKLDNPLEDEKREAQIKRYIDSAKAVGGKVGKIVSQDNSLLAAIKAGTKGNEVNFSQITTLLAQMFLKGNRFPNSITDHTRCSPYFEPESLDIRSRGFCMNSFLTGLTPAELFFSQASGRIGLMDTALKTADVGDMHRRMVKILEDIRIAYDGSVRNNTGRIFQFVYGEDGMDARELQFVHSSPENVPMFVDVFKEARRLNTKYSKM